jgi:hypothetical protein
MAQKSKNERQVGFMNKYVVASLIFGLGTIASPESAKATTATGFSVDYLGSSYEVEICEGVDSQTKCKFCIKTESCTEYEEWEPTIVT